MAGHATDRGWFADTDPDQHDRGRQWQPCLQLDGLRLPFDVWFETEAECVAFINDQVLGRGMLALPDATPDALRRRRESP